MSIEDPVNPYAAPRGDLHPFDDLGVIEPVREYAGFWLRFGAFLLDYCILYFLNIMVLAGLFLLISPLGIDGKRLYLPIVVSTLFTKYLLPFGYFTLLESSTAQATPGKLALGIKVTDLTGRRLTWYRALGRNLGKLVSAIILFLGYILAGFTDRKQALHDIMAGTLVVKR